MLIAMRAYFYLVLYIFRLLVDRLLTSRMSDQQKDLEIILLRHQLRILQRKLPNSRPPRISPLEKGFLAVLAAQFRRCSGRTGRRLDEVVLLFKPDTVLRWHRELVRRKWTFSEGRLTGRPPLAAELEQLIVELARENPRWGYSKIQGELMKLGYQVSRSSVRNALKRNGIHPSPQRRKRGSSWRSFLGHYAGQMIACDFFMVETIRFRTLYMLFFIELATRRVHVARCTAHPTSEWVTQQARNLTWDVANTGNGDRELPVRFLIHDRDAKFTSSFDAVFHSEGVESVLTPYRCPKANAFAERWVRTIREECLDRLLILSEVHLRRVLVEYTEYYNHRRAHQGTGQCIPVPLWGKKRETWPATGDPVCRTEVLGGIIHDYYRGDSNAA
jgi:putative transposase